MQVPDELERVIQREVQEGRAASATDFLEEAIRRLVNDAQAEHDDIWRRAEEGIADADAGRFTTIATREDDRLLHERLMTRLRDGVLRG